MATNEQPSPTGVTVTLREIYDQVQTLRKWMWAMPPTLIASVSSLVVALTTRQEDEYG